MTANKTFCQLLSNALQANIAKPANIESTALGACVVSQIAEGLSIKDINLKLEDMYEPDTSSKEFYIKDYLSWKDYLNRTISNIK
jgi:glycerol kinase